MAEQKRNSCHTKETTPDDPSVENATWFYRHAGAVHGPISSTDLRAAAHLGFLQPSDAVLCKGHKKWIVARSLSWLFTSPP